jgi:hypothetical protein
MNAKFPINFWKLGAIMFAPIGFDGKFRLKRYLEVAL